MKKIFFTFLAIVFGMYTFAQNTHTTWTGNTNSDWATATNWDSGLEPDEHDNVVIPPSPSMQPIVATGTTTAVCREMSILPGASLTINGKLGFYGNIINFGNIEVNGEFVYLVADATPTIVSARTGRLWMDRNLGATRVALSLDDEEAYGYLYQWGRATEGHEKRNSNTSNDVATTSAPNGGNSWDGLFIAGLHNWLTPPDDSLWQGTEGINNPCPSGFRLPTHSEWANEHLGNTDNAFDKLKLPIGGDRTISGHINSPGNRGVYWSSTEADNSQISCLFMTGSGYLSTELRWDRGQGVNVRCIKEH